MNKSIKHLFLLAMVLPLLFAGCNDWFNKGDTQKTYDGPDTVGFKPLQSEIDEGTSQTLEVQFISSKGNAQSDIQVQFSIDGSSTADPNYYSVSSSPVTISSGSVKATVTVQTSDDPNLNAGDEATLILTIDSADGAQVGEKLKSSTIYIKGT